MAKNKMIKFSLDDFSAFDINDTAKFKTFRKKLDGIYRNETALSNRFQHQALNRALFNIKKREDLEALLEQGFSNASNVINISKQLQSLDPNYSKIISYFADMFFIRYTTIPVLVKRDQKINDKEYLSIYNDMIEAADGLNLETAVPDILNELFLSGQVYLTAKKDSKTKSVGIIFLPAEYCRTVLKTSLGTNLIEFNSKYFDKFQLEADRELVFTLFPKEFGDNYKKYKAGEKEPGVKDQGWFTLDPKFSTSFLINDRGLPPFINSMQGIFEYDRVRDAETQKTENQLKKLFIHRIPTTSNGELIFDLDEVRDIHGAIARIVRKHDGLDTLTVFGETELLNLQEESSVENKAITQAYQAVFNSSGLNSEIFMGDSQEAILANHKIDKAYVWRHLAGINNYLNVVINNLYNFSPFQAEVNILPITVMDESEKVLEYRESASYGIGKIEAIVATGIKQKHLMDRARLEEILDLDNLLKPLQSSHTQSSDSPSAAKTPNQQKPLKEIEEEDGSDEEQLDPDKEVKIDEQ